MSTENKIDLSTKSDVELKAIAYDIRQVVDVYTQHFQVVTQEIARRAEQVAVPEEKITTDEKVKTLPRKK